MSECRTPEGMDQNLLQLRSVVLREGCRPDAIVLRPVFAVDTHAHFYQRPLNSSAGRRFMWDRTPYELPGIEGFLQEFKEGAGCAYFFVDVERELPQDLWFDEKHTMPMCLGVGPPRLVTREQRFLGHVGVRRDARDGKYWLNYYNANLALRGHGYMGRAVRLLVNHVSSLNIRLWARVSQANLPSLGILRNCMSLDRDDGDFLYFRN